MNGVTDRRIIREIGRIISGGYEDTQGLRKGMMNQIRDLVRHIDENLPVDQPEEKKEKKSFEKKYADSNLPKLIENLFIQGRLPEEERSYLVGLIDLVEKAKALEKSYKKSMRDFARSEIIWEKFLSHIPGIGNVLAAKLIVKLPCERYRNVSALWRHCGLHLVCPVCTEKVRVKDKKDEKGKWVVKILPVLANGEGICPKCKRRGVSPVRRAGKNIDYTPNRRTFVWNIGESLIKQKSAVYYNIYVREKQKQAGRRFVAGELKEISAPLYAKEESNPYKEDDAALKKDHTHKRAMRKMVKIFLQHYWVVYRLLAKLPVTAPYIQGKMGHADIITWEDVMRANGQNPEDVLKPMEKAAKVVKVAKHPKKKKDAEADAA